METARLHLECYGREDKHILRCIVTLDETWVRCYLRKLKKQLNERQHNDSPQLKKYRREQDPLKDMFIVSYDFDDFLVTHSVPVKDHVNGAYYSSFLEHHLRPVVQRKCPNLLNSHPTVLQDGARSLSHSCSCWLIYFADETGKFCIILHTPQI